VIKFGAAQDETKFQCLSAAGPPFARDGTDPLQEKTKLRGSRKPKREFTVIFANSHRLELFVYIYFNFKGPARG
jgi:hypothetical protein